MSLVMKQANFLKFLPCDELEKLDQSQNSNCKCFKKFVVTFLYSIPELRSAGIQNGQKLVSHTGDQYIGKPDKIFCLIFYKKTYLSYRYLSHCHFKCVSHYSFCTAIKWDLTCISAISIRGRTVIISA